MDLRDRFEVRKSRLRKAHTHVQSSNYVWWKPMMCSPCTRVAMLTTNVKFFKRLFHCLHLGTLCRAESYRGLNLKKWKQKLTLDTCVLVYNVLYIILTCKSVLVHKSVWLNKCCVRGMLRFLLHFANNYEIWSFDMYNSYHAVKKHECENSKWIYKKYYYIFEFLLDLQQVGLLSLYISDLL